MRITTATFLVGLCSFTLALPVQEGFNKVADKEFLQKQKDILRLLRYVNQPSYYKDHVDLANTYKFDETSFTKPEVVKNFVKYYDSGLLPRGEIFSVFYKEHLEQAIALFKVFYYAKNYDTFYKTAVWARNHVNEGIFLYALSVAIVHKPETYGIVLPPIYEVNPHYFHNSEVIHKAYKYKQQYQGDKSYEHGYTIDANYSGYYLNLHPDQSLSYFMEDVGVNSYYYYYNLYYPFWMDGEEFHLKDDHRGELYYFYYQQLLARYYLERLANGFGEVEWFNWEVPFQTGYHASLTYPNGFSFPSRPHYAKLSEYFYNYGQRWTFKRRYGYSYTLVQLYEKRILDAIDKGYAYDPEGKIVYFNTAEGVKTLGNLIESNPDSPDSKYYGDYQMYARHLLGYSSQPLDNYKVAPSALEHFETSFRDPAFYQFYKRIVVFFQKFKSHHLKPYTENELYFNGVEVKKVEFDRLITYFDYFYSDLSNGVFVTPEEFEQDKFHVRARQYRLNHKPFTYKVYINSDKEQESVVRIYMGPKYDEYGRHINISENRLNFAEFDHFKYHLKSGENVIERNSHQNFYYQPDRTSFRDLYKKVLGALEGQSEFHLDGSEAYPGFPQRFLLPKGSYDGFEFQFFVIVSPYVPYKHHKEVDHNKYYYPQVGTGAVHLDGLSCGFPFDRVVDDEQFFYNAPNTYFYTTKIYHRNVDDINAIGRT